jgi:protein-S-isoprenylcysteine O-methyltransferase Ste14
LGGLSLYLPVYGYFTYTMFFLAGIGVLRVLWLPLIDVSPLILRLGDIVFLPIYLVYSSLAIISRDLATTVIILLSFSLFILGLWLFSLGVFTWLYGRFRGVEILDFWIYRFSRHPQYLGFLVWSYGFTLLTPAGGALGAWILPIPSLIWLVTALIIIGVALSEELEMIRRYGDKYLAYREKTPFMMPLPKTLSSIIRWPVKLILGKDMPQNGREVVLVIIFYLIVLIVLSIPIVLYYKII